MRRPESFEFSCSFHLFEITRLPASVEGRLLGAVNAEVDEPSLAGNGFESIDALCRKAPSDPRLRRVQLPGSVVFAWFQGPPIRRRPQAPTVRGKGTSWV